MATKLAGYTDRERAVLKECRRKSIAGGLKWGLPSLLPLWVAFKARLLPPVLAPPSYTVAFVVFTLLGSMAQNDSCIESILDIEDSELAEKLRKKLPRQAGRYDRQKALRTSRTKKDDSTTATVDRTPTTVSDTPPYAFTGEHVESSWQGRESRGGGGGGGGDSGSGEWMQRQDDKRAVRRNKYGDIVYDDDIK